jgi:farnesyl-diphosphate farnesyltransferase
MPEPTRSLLLGPLLKSVSRSFYLTLRVLPLGMREPVGVAYLLARAADTIADTALIASGRRLELLSGLREAVNGGGGGEALAAIRAEVAGAQSDSGEKTLLESVEPAVALVDGLGAGDREAVRRIVTTLTTGMEFDLRTFPNETSGRVAALAGYAELDRYTYLVAGCVGEFWTAMTAAHVTRGMRAPLETMLARGVRFGKALQLTNVLRDCGKDLRIGRCYLPAEMLAAARVAPEELLEPGTGARARGVLAELLGRALEHYREAVAYTSALPRRQVRLRLACLWPVLIGLETLLLVAANERWLDPAAPSKVRRGQVYRLMLLSLPMVVSNGLLRRWSTRRMALVAARLR